MGALNIAAGSSIRRDETVEIVPLLAFAGGYIDAYTWIKTIPNLALGIPVIALLVVLLCCEAGQSEMRV